MLIVKRKSADLGALSERNKALDSICLVCFTKQPSSIFFKMEAKKRRKKKKTPVELISCSHCLRKKVPKPSLGAFLRIPPEPSRPSPSHWEVRGETCRKGLLDPRFPGPRSPRAHTRAPGPSTPCRRGLPTSVLHGQVLSHRVVKQLVHQHLVRRRAGPCLQGPAICTVSP